MHILISELINPLVGFSRAGRIAYRYVIGCIKNPDPGSEFDKKTRDIRFLPGPVLLALLLWNRYGGMVDIDSDGVIGHVFCQSHRDGVHLFSIYVAKPRRGRGVAVSLLASFVALMWLRGVRQIRLGGDGSEAMKRLRQSYIRNGVSLSFFLQEKENAWVELVPILPPHYEAVPKAA